VEGALACEGASVVGRTSSHQIAVRSVAEGGHPTELHSYGGVFRSELTVCFWSSFSGFASLYVGCTFLGHLEVLDLCFSLDLAAIVSGSFIFCTCCIPPSSFLIYRHIFQTGFPRGVLSRVMLTKNTYVQKCMC
jgi:hypothetical protein